MKLSPLTKIGIIGHVDVGKTCFTQIAAELKEAKNEKVYLVVPDKDAEAIQLQITELKIDSTNLIIVNASEVKQTLGIEVDVPPIPIKNYRCEPIELKIPTIEYSLDFNDKPKHGKASRREINRRGF